jgi:TonB family protein
VPGPAESADPVEIDLEKHADLRFSSWKMDKPDCEIRMAGSVIERISREALAAADSEINGALTGRREPGTSEVIWIEGHVALKTAPETWPRDTVAFYRATSSSAGFTDSEGLPDRPYLEVHWGAEGTPQGQFYFPAGTAHEAAGPSFPFTTPHAKPRRLVPDFEQAATPRKEILLPPRPTSSVDTEPLPGSRRGWLWPFIAALVLIGGAVWALPRFLSSDKPTGGVADSVRLPLGLSVDPSGPAWRISWNRDAAMLNGAQRVRLFIRDYSGGGEQNGIDLTGPDLEGGMYAYTPAVRSGPVDVAFRMEAVTRDGTVSAETYRLMRTAASSLAAPSSTAPGTAAPGTSGTTAEAQVPQVGPKVLRRVPPVIPASIRPRIRGKIPIDVKVEIDRRGAVTSAESITKTRSGVETLLARSAVRAAKQWRFEPAKRDGKAVAGTQTVHFVFEQ